jgi:ParB-like chromosome segregation protein Spo0J
MPDEPPSTRSTVQLANVNGHSFHRHTGNGHRTNGESHGYALESGGLTLVQPAVSVPISELRPADSPRIGGLDAEHAQSLADVDNDLPPILVRRATMRVIDGMHRLNAARLRGRDSINVQFFDGDQEQAFLLAVQTNITHGLPLRIGERRAAAARIVRTHPEMSDRSIAAIAGLAAKTVAAIRGATDDCPEVTTRVGRDGRIRPLNSADGRRIAGSMFLERPDASLRKIAKAAGISVGTARDVRERIRRGEDPALPRQHTKSPSDTDGASRLAASNSRRGIDAVDHRLILEHLRRDPSLRYNDSGRTLLRWLAQRAIGTDDWKIVVTQIPPHCAIVVARIARGSALAWTELAEALDERVQKCAS